MKPTSSNLILMLSLSALLVASVQSVSAATLYWDGTDTTADADGGAGSWDTVTLNWDDAAIAGTNSAWPSGATDSVAVFGTLGGAVVIDPAGMSANSVNFKVASYVVSGGPLTLNGTVPSITTGTASGATYTAAISSNLLGSAGLAYVGTGPVLLSGDNTGLSGVLNLSGNAGASNESGVRLLNNLAIGGLSSVVIQDKSYLGLTGVTLGTGVAITVNGGGGTTAPTGSLRNISGDSVVNGPVSIASSTVRFSNISGTTGSLTINGAVTSTNPAFGLTLRNNDAAGVIFTNPANSWGGTTDIAQGSPAFFAGALPATTNLYIASVLNADFGTNGTFTRDFGTGPGQVRFGRANDAARSGGFSARGGDLTVNFGGAAADLKFLGAFAKTGATTSTSPTVTVTDGSSILVGMSVTGTGIPVDTLVTAVAGTTITLNKPATVTGLTVALSFYAVQDNSRLNSNILILNGASGTGRTTLLNPLDLNGFSRTVNNSASESFISAGVKNTAVAKASLTVTGAGNTTVNSLIEDGSGSVVSLGKAGSGTLFLSLDNTFTGAITFSGGANNDSGKIRLSTGGALGSGTKSVTMTGSTGTARGAIELTNNITVPSKNLQLGGRSIGPTYASLRNVSGDNTWEGSVSIAGPGGGYSLENVAGQLTLSGTVSNTVANSPRVLNFYGAGNTIITGAYRNSSATSTTGLELRGPGNVILRNANDYSAGTTVYAGSLIAQRTTQVALGTGFVTVSTDANVTISDHAGGGQLPYTNNFTLTGSGIAGGGALGFYNSGGFDVSGTIIISSGITIRTDTVNQTATSTVTFTNVISGTGDLTLFGQGSTAIGTPRFNLTGASTYTGDTLLTSSGVNTTPFTVTLSGGADRLPITTNLIFGGTPAGAPTGTFDKATTLALDGVSQEIASISNANAGNYRVVGASSNAGTLVVNNSLASSFSGVLGGSGTNENNLGLTKNGSGALTLSGASTYTGNTTVIDGILSLGASSLGDRSTVTIGTASGSPAVLDLPNSVTYVVASLVIDGVAQPSGVTYDSSNSGLAITGPGKIQVVPPANNYSTWATANGISGQPASGDFDNDGLTNLVEYALGLNPTSSSVPAGTFSGGVLSFTKGAEAIANGDVNFVIEKSADLGISDPWTPVVTQTAPNASTTISYTLPTGQPKVFARLKVTQIP